MKGALLAFMLGAAALVVEIAGPAPASSSPESFFSSLSPSGL